MRRVGAVVAALCLLPFVVTLYGCGGSGGPGGPGEGSAGKPPAGDGQYYVTVLPKPAGVNACAEAISDQSAGVVWAGGGWNDGNGSDSVVWRVVLPPEPGGEPTVQETKVSEGGRIDDINQYGRAVGSQGGEALYYDGSAPHVLQDSGSSTYGRGIGTDGATVRIAAYGTSGASGALLWEFPFGSLPDPTNPDFTRTVLPGLADGFQSRTAEAICDSDPDEVRIAGRAEDPDSLGTSAAVMWTRPTDGQFGTPTKMAAEPAYPQEVNQSGQVVGMWANNWRDAWLWQDGALTVLPWIRGKWSDHEAYGTNDAGVVVGYARYQVGVTVKAVKPVIWRSGQAADLNSLVTVSGGLTAAYDINNAGMIVAVGPGSDGKTNAYLLRPK